MKHWLPSTIGYAFAIGGFGIAIKIALRTVDWPILLLSVTVAQLMLVAAYAGAIHFPSRAGPAWIYIVLVGILGAGAFPLLNLALRFGPASQVIPISAAYPIVTVVLAAVVLSEPVTIVRAVGVVLIVGGAMLVSR